MEKIIELLAVVISAYIIGSIPTGYIIVKTLTGEDIRTIGSGSTGATNVITTNISASTLSNLDFNRIWQLNSAEDIASKGYLRLKTVLVDTTTSSSTLSTK